MKKPKVIAYLKTTCGWSQGVRAVLRKYDLLFEDRDIIKDPAQRAEMVQRSGQTLSPCVEVEGQMLSDISGEELESYLVQAGWVQKSDRQPDMPINQPCPNEV